MPHMNVVISVKPHNLFMSAVNATSGQISISTDLSLNLLETLAILPNDSTVLSTELLQQAQLRCLEQRHIF